MLLKVPNSMSCSIRNFVPDTTQLAAFRCRSAFVSRLIESPHGRHWFSMPIGRSHSKIYSGHRWFLVELQRLVTCSHPLNPPRPTEHCSFSHPVCQNWSTPISRFYFEAYQLTTINITGRCIEKEPTSSKISRHVLMQCGIMNNMLVKQEATSHWSNSKIQNYPFVPCSCQTHESLSH